MRILWAAAIAAGALQAAGLGVIHVTLEADATPVYVGREVTVTLKAQGDGSGLAGLAGRIVATGDAAFESKADSFAWVATFSGLTTYGIPPVPGVASANGGWEGFGSSQSQLPFSATFAKDSLVQVASYTLRSVAPGSVTLAFESAEVASWHAAETDGTGTIGSLVGVTLAASVLQGDLNLDGHVDVQDLLIFADSWTKSLGDEGYNPACDFSGDQMVDIVDLLIFTENWGQ